MKVSELMNPAGVRLYANIKEAADVLGILVELQEETGATADHWLPCVMLSPSTPRWQWEKSLVTTEYSMLFSSALKLAAGILRLLPSL